MNVLQGTIVSVEVSGELSLVKADCAGTVISAIVIDTVETAPYLKKDQPIQVIFKETEVVLGKGTDHQVSLQNRLVGKVKDIQKGALLSKVTISIAAAEITSIITTSAVTQLRLERGTTVCAMIKTNEVMLSE
jgi:molybdate transport system regulatory protein